MKSTLTTPAIALLFSLSSLAIGCGGDVTSGVGENGLLRYSLYTTYDVPQDDLSEARIITGHQQRISVSMTAEGLEDVKQPNDITHRFKPADGTSWAEQTVPTDVEGDYIIPAVFTVSTAGEYTLESVADGKVIDYISLQFETPAGFEMSIKVRDQWGSSFEAETGDPVTVDEGSQVILLAIPVDAEDERLAGVMTPTITVDPTWAVTPGYNVYSNTEDVTWRSEGPPDYYFIEPVLVTFTITDPVSEASTTQQFDVQPVN
jgi:hypothetical protein